MIGQGPDSVPRGVEAGVAVGHLGLTVVLFHLRERQAVSVKLSRCLVPPDGEVLREGTADVGTVGCWLGDQFVEGFAGALPVSALHSEEGCEGKGGGHTENEVLGLGAQDWSHQRVRKAPADNQVSERLASELLNLR